MVKELCICADLDYSQSIFFQREKRRAQFDYSDSDITDLYVARDPSEIRATEIDYISDEMFVRASRELALAAAKAGQNAFLYVFGRNMGQPDERASHYMEVKYVFNKLSRIGTKRRCDAVESHDGGLLGAICPFR